jgi:hypothetical protein
MAPKRKTRARQAQLAFDALAIEGGVLSPEWLSKVAQLQAGSQSESDYRVPKGLNLRDEIGRYWRIAQAHWVEFAQGRKANGDGKALAERFVTSLLRDAFGFASLRAIEPILIAGRAYPIGHAANDGRVAVVIGPADGGLDTPSLEFGDGGRRRSAFGLTQEFLNACESALWGLTSDGHRLRIGRDNASLTRPAWIEADLARIFTEERYADFAALWLLVHETRFGREGQPATDCVLESWRNAGREEGTRAREDLREGVKEALIALGQGFLSHPENQPLRAKLQTRAMSTKGYFNELLRLVYRLIFLLTVEERGLLHPEGTAEAVKQLYRDGYSLRRLRDRSVKRSAHDRFADLWEATKIVVRGLAAGEPRLGLPALAGLFAPTQSPTLDTARLENRAVLLAVFRLAWLKDGGALARVNWRDMGPEELGSVYESLLELVPEITKDGRQFAFATGSETKGNARKTTGTYYTPDSLVQVLLESALEPVVAETIAKNPDDPVEALLGLSIVDPACGSGHFLLAAARRLAAHVARLQANGTPTAAEYRHALRQVIGRCIYGVDLNPMAVELCKVSLWMEAVEPGLPMTFLNSHIQHGDALLGVTPDLMAKGVPDSAWEPIEGDDRNVASALKRRNKKESGGQRTLGFDSRLLIDAEQEELACAMAQLEDASDTTPEALALKESQWDDITLSGEYRHQKFVADAWCAAFVWPKEPGDLAHAAPTNELWRRVRDGEGQPPALTVRTVSELTDEYRFFHWHLQFPLVLRRGGFDVVLGNPPWDQVQFREPEFFAQLAPDVAAAKTAAVRSKQIEMLRTSAPTIFEAFLRKKRAVAATGHFLRSSGVFPLTGNRRLNLYSMFAELAQGRRAVTGRAGLVLPSGIVTDENSAELFAFLIERSVLHSVFELNNAGFFPDAGSGHVNRFVLFVLGPPSEGARFLFRGCSLRELYDTDRVVVLRESDFRLLNPNVPTCPVLMNARDAAILRELHQRAGALVLESVPNGNPWELATVSAFNMSDDSELFRSNQDESVLPLYESKMFSLFDHRFGDYSTVTPLEESHILPKPDDAHHANPYFFVMPRHWLPEEEVRYRMREWNRRWVVAWRDVTNDANARTCVVAVLGDVAIARNNAPGLFPLVEPRRVPLLVASLSTFVVDFACRKKLGGTHLTRTALYQLPVLPPATYDAETPWARGACVRDWFLPRLLELIYTAWDLEPFACDVGYDGPPFRWDPARRFLLRCEIDAGFFHLYELSRDDTAYVMDTFQSVRNSDEKANGEYRTKRVILEIYDAIAEAARTGQPYQTRLDPPAADPRVAHPSRGGQIVAFPIPGIGSDHVPHVAADRQLPQWSPELLAAVAAATGLNLFGGSWATSLSGFDLGITALAAVLRNMQGPSSQEDIERAVVLTVLPNLLQTKFDIESARTWRQVIGAPNVALTSIAAVAIPWDEVVRRARIEHVLDERPDGRWSAGPDVQNARSRELDARSIVSLSWLAHSSAEDQEVTAQLGVLRAG